MTAVVTVCITCLTLNSLHFAKRMYVFHMYLTKKSNYFLNQHYPTGLCNGNAGRNWIFMYYLDKLQASNSAAPVSSHYFCNIFTFIQLLSEWQVGVAWKHSNTMILLPPHNHAIQFNRLNCIFLLMTYSRVAHKMIQYLI